MQSLDRKIPLGVFQIRQKKKKKKERELQRNQMTEILGYKYDADERSCLKKKKELLNASTGFGLIRPQPQ